MRWDRKRLANLQRVGSIDAIPPSGQLKFTKDELTDLALNLQGHISWYMTADFDSARQGFCNTWQESPQIIIYCECITDVQKAIHFAIKHDLTPVCRSGGHSTAGYSLNDQLILDTSGINFALINEDSQTAVVGPGCNFSKLNAELTRTGLHVPGGGCPTVNVAGYMQGGGYGFTSMMFGLNCDHVTAVQMVLPNGDLVTADDEHHRDLFWAVRGGTGNQFGVLVEITYKLVPLEDELWGWGLNYPLDSHENREIAARAMSVYNEHYTGEHVNRGLGSQGLLVYMGGTPYFMLRGMFRGSEAECAELLRPMTDLMLDQKQQTDIWQSGDYASLNARLLQDAAQNDIPNVPYNIRCVVDSRMIDETHDPDDWGRVIDWFMASPNQDNFIGIETHGGAIWDVAPGDTAFRHRHARMDVFTWVFWLYDEHRMEAEAYNQRFCELLDGLSNGYAYQNYPNRATTDYTWRYWGENYPRLQQVKAHYDPDRLFRFDQMIHPEP